jgi:hypothetical protein
VKRLGYDSYQRGTSESVIVAKPLSSVWVQAMFVKYMSSAVGILGLVLLVHCTRFASAAESPLPTPTATLELFTLLTRGNGEPTWETVTYLSESTVAIGLCRHRACSLSLIRWEDENLTMSAQTFQFKPGVSIHAASNGRLFTAPSLAPTVLYSADLSRSHELATHIARVSRSGKTVSEWSHGSWKTYRLTETLEPIREGDGDLQSLSDEVLVIQDGKTIRTETLDGRRMGSFSLPSMAWGHVAVLGNARLYMDDCTKARIVDFNGKVYLEVHPKDLYKQGSRWFTDASVCAQGDESSSDGKRILFDFATRNVPKPQHILESIHTISTLDMTGPEDVNGEEVRVMDSGNGKLCFGWHRSFPNWLVRSAAISPSGESVSIVVGDKLSIYRLPSVCDGTVRIHE